MSGAFFDCVEQIDLFACVCSVVVLWLRGYVSVSVTYIDCSTIFGDSRQVCVENRMCAWLSLQIIQPSTFNFWFGFKFSSLCLSLALLTLCVCVLHLYDVSLLKCFSIQHALPFHIWIQVFRKSLLTTLIVIAHVRAFELFWSSTTETVYVFACACGWERERIHNLHP